MTHIQRHASGSYAKLATETASKEKSKRGRGTVGLKWAFQMCDDIMARAARATVGLKWAFQMCDVGEFLLPETGGCNLIN